MRLARSWRWRYACARSREIFLDGDATTVRTLLAVGSLFWAITLWWPRLHPFDRAPYAWMAWIAPDWAWGVAMFLHFGGVMWRLYEVKSRPGWQFAINLYGVSLWTFLVGCITVAVGEFTPGLAIEIALIIAAWVCLPSTGSNEGKGTP